MPVDAKKLDDMMRKISGLIAKADHPNTPIMEADSCRAMAERLMRKYRIEESELIESGGVSIDVISRVMHYSPVDSPYRSAYMTMAACVIDHVGGRAVHGSNVNLEGAMFSTLQMFGYEADIRFAEALFQSARIVFADRMEPKRSTELSDEDNVYRMRSAGMERIRIAEVMGYGTTTSATAKVTRLYKKACAARGEDATLTGRGTSVAAFREAYVDGFVTTFNTRLWNARNAADSGEGGIVLANRKENVDEAMYKRYPSLRPDPNRRSVAVRQSRRSGWTKADEARMNRMNGAAGQAGKSAGRDAASTVDVGGVKPSQRLSEG